MGKNEGIKPLKVLFTILSIILLSALTVFSYALWEDVKKTELNKLYKENQTLINQSRSFFDHQTRLIVKTIKPRFVFPKLQPRVLNNVFDYLSSATDEVAVYSLIDLEGNTLLNKGSITAPKLSEQSNSIIQSVKTNQTAQIGYLHRAGLLGESFLPFYVPYIG